MIQLTEQEHARLEAVATQLKTLLTKLPWAVVYRGQIIGAFRMMARAEQLAQLGNKGTPGGGVTVVPIDEALKLIGGAA